MEFWVNNEGERVTVGGGDQAAQEATARPNRRPESDDDDDINYGGYAEYEEEATEPMVLLPTMATVSTTTDARAVTMPGEDQVIDPNSEIFEGCGETKSCFGTPSNN